ncbi:MAG TPA: copper resistance protein NlpE [Chitinophagaceae bacterium]
MKKIIIFLAILFFVLMACNNAEEKKDKKADTTAAPVVKKDPVVTASYTGVTPCADCKGIEVTITLMDDDTYKKRDLYIGRKSTGEGSNEITASGKFMMHGDTLHLLGINDGADHFLKADSTLVQLGPDGKRISGNLGDQYVLKRI